MSRAGMEKYAQFGLKDDTIPIIHTIPKQAPLACSTMRQHSTNHMKNLTLPILTETMHHFRQRIRPSY